IPEGSSAEAPVMRPGPSSLKKRLNGFFSLSSSASSDLVGCSTCGACGLPESPDSSRLRRSLADTPFAMLASEAHLRVYLYQAVSPGAHQIIKSRATKIRWARGILLLKNT